MSRSARLGCVPARSAMLVSSLVSFLFASCLSVDIWYAAHLSAKRLGDPANDPRTTFVLVAVVCTLMAFASLLGTVWSATRGRQFVSIFPAMSTFLILASFVSAMLFLFMLPNGWRSSPACSSTDVDCPMDPIVVAMLVFVTVKPLELLVQFYIFFVIRPHAQRLNHDTTVRQGYYQLFSTSVNY